MVDFVTGKLTPEVARRRMVETTQEQLAALTNDPAFHAWQAAKARRENRASIVTNLATVAACVALVVTLALLKPAANAPAGAQVGHLQRRKSVPDAWRCQDDQQFVVFGVCRCQLVQRYLRCAPT